MLKKDMITVYADCSICGKTKPLHVNSEGFKQWVNKLQLIQIALPELDKTDRELLISQTCGDCWTNLFGSDDQI